MTNLDVEIAALDTHANELTRAADRIGEVSGAALGSMALQPAAFGILCSFLVPVVMAQQTSALAGMASVGAAVHAESAAIKTAATAYRAADSELAEALRKLLGL